MRRKALLWSFLLTTVIGFGQSEQEPGLDKSLKTAILDIFQLSAERNISEIDERYIHPEFGVYDVFRIGVPDTFGQYSSIGFAFPTRENSLMYPNLMEVTETLIVPEIIAYNAVFDCGEMVWDREGLFVTDSISYPKLSDIAKQPVFETSDFPESFHDNVKHIEKHSYRVVLTEFEIIFYITRIDGGWYLTLFDRVTTDCSA